MNTRTFEFYKSIYFLAILLSLTSSINFSWLQTVNDVIAGIIFLGTRLYMQEMRQGSGEANSTTLVLLNTRAFRSYESVKDMVKPDAKSPWGNYFAFLHVSIPKLADDWSSNPLDFVVKARQIMNVKKNSLGAYLTGRLLEIVRKFRGPEVRNIKKYQLL